MTSNDYKRYKKAKCYGRTDGPTDGRTDGAGCRVACTRLKKQLRFEAKDLLSFFFSCLYIYWQNHTISQLVYVVLIRINEVQMTHVHKNH